jgi:hypothetical protein
MKKTLLALITILSFTQLNQAGTFSIFSSNATISGITTTISGLWGTFSSGTFTPLLTSTPTAGLNTGYFDGSVNGPELSVDLSQNNNTIISAGTALALAIYAGPNGSTYSTSVNQIVLTDSSWVAPTFGVSSSNSAFFTGSTSMASLTGFTGGSYNFNSGAPIMSLQVVPEPSTYALMALGGLVLFFIARRRKAQA